MRRRRYDSGMTLVEMMTVVAIIGLLAVILGFSYRGWIAKYKVEDETKQLFMTLTEARARALQRNRASFVNLEANRCRTYEDTSPAPEGDGILQTASDTLIASSGTISTITSALPGGVMEFAFNRDGIASVGSGYIRLSGNPGVSSDYDCITIQATRIKMGKVNGGTCQEQ